MGSIKYIETRGDYLGPAGYSSNAQAAGMVTLKPRHREIMRRLCCGQHSRDIAKEMGITPAGLNIIINSPLFKIELRKMERDLRQHVIEKIGDVSARIAKLQVPALDVLEGIIVDKDKVAGLALKQKTAIAVLELAGTKKGKNDEGMNDFAQFIAESYNAAKQREWDRLNSTLEEDSRRLRADGSIDVTPESVVREEEEKEDAELASFNPTPSISPEEMEAMETSSESESVSVSVQTTSDEIDGPDEAFELKVTSAKSGGLIDEISPSERLELKEEIEREDLRDKRHKKAFPEENLTTLLFKTMIREGVKVEEIQKLLND
jgi:hypothetical protein